MYAEVIMDIKQHAINQTFDYLIPDHLRDVCEVGMRVFVPFSHGNSLAVIIKIKNQTSIEHVKTIHELDTSMPVISERQFAIIHYLVTKYRLMYAQAIDLVIPSLYHSKVNTVIRRLEGALDETISNKFNKKGIWILKKSERSLLPKLKRLQNEQKIDIVQNMDIEKKQKMSFHYEINPIVTIYSDLIDGLQQQHYKKKDLLEFGLKESQIKHLIQHKNIIKVVEHDAHAYTYGLDQLRLDSHLVGPLHHFYRQLNLHVNYCINQKKTLLILVPRESMMDSVKNAINQNVITYSGNLTLAQKRRVIHSIQSSQIVIGTRSALFLPYQSIDHIVVIDSASEFYTLNKGMYYDTIDIIQTHFKGSQVVFHSNIDSPIILELETHQKVLRYPFKPSIQLVSMKDELLQGNTSIISNQLNLKIVNALNQHKKVFIIHQRKGYHLANTCRMCGHVSTCETCHVAYHVTKDNTLFCTECSKTEPLVKTCIHHHENMMKPIGIGLNYVVDACRNMYPNYRVSSVEQQTKHIESVIDHAHIIIGTSILSNYPQYLEKGLVSFLIFDTLLQNYDIKSSYHALNTMLAFSNYTIKDLREPLLIQTYQPNHEVYKAIENPRNFVKSFQSNLEVFMAGRNYMHYELYVDATSYLKGYQDALKVKMKLIAFAHVIGPRKRYDEENFFTLTIKVHESKRSDVTNIFDTLPYEVKPI